MIEVQLRNQTKENSNSNSINVSLFGADDTDGYAGGSGPFHEEFRRLAVPQLVVKGDQKVGLRRKHHVVSS